jgi:uncharacterized protein (DUF2252 family)
VLLERIGGLLAAYRGTLPADRRHLLDHFTLADVAHKVVGVGSVGTRAWIFLLEGGMESEALLLQGKQAEASVLAGYAGRSEYANQGERVVTGQRLMQATSDIFLGWLRTQSPDGGDEDYYLRQLRDWKLSAEIELMRPESMALYARLCGWTLARAHARSGDRIAISAYRAARPGSTTPSPTSPRPTPTRTNATTARSRPPSPKDASRHNPGSELSGTEAGRGRRAVSGRSSPG